MTEEELEQAEAIHRDYSGQSASDKPSGGFEFVAVGDLQYSPPEFLIDGLIETETLGLMFGDPGCGKSFVAVDIGLSVATGEAFHGREVKPGAVFFIAGEGHSGLARRFHAWGSDRGVSIADAPLFKSNRAAQFLDGQSAKNVADAVGALAAQHGDPALIIIDTLARNYGPGDENSTSDMSAFVAAIDNLKAQFPGCAVLIVHHSGHVDKGRARGAMALKGALDCEYRVEKNLSIIRLVNTKMKDAEAPGDVAFEFRSVELAGGASSAVLVETEATAKTKGPTPTQKVAHKTFIAAAAQSGVWDDDGFAGLHLDDWRVEFYAKHDGDNTEAKKKAFQRVRRDLTTNGQISVVSDVYRWNDEAVTMAIIMQRGSGTDGTKRDIVPECPDAEVGMSGTDGTSA